MAAVELAVGGEGDVVDVEVEPHADGVGGDEDSRRRRTGTAATWALRVRGESAPSTTAAPPRWRRISSAMA